MTAQLSLSLEQLVDRGVTSHRAGKIVSQINQGCSAIAAIDCWQHLTQHVLKPDDPFPLHQLLYETTFAEWDTMQQGPPPAWVPTDEQIQATHIAAFMRELNVDSYSAFHAWSVQNRAKFWHRMIQRLGIRFQKQASEIIHCLDDIESPKWLVGARFNIVDS
jgi:acetyl-CoA synthetase